MADLSTALKEAYASAPAVIVHHTLEIYHPEFTVPIRVVRDTVDLTATLEDGAPRNAGEEVLFTAWAFNVVPPDVQASSMPRCTIEIDNVSREILAQIMLATTTSDVVSIIYRQYLSGSLDGPENDPPLELIVLDVAVTALRIRVTCGFSDFLNKRFPAEVYTAMRFPGLVAL